MSFFLCFVINAQSRILDSLNNELKTASQDTTLANTYNTLSTYLYDSDPDTVIAISKFVLQLYEKNKATTSLSVKRSLLLNAAIANQNIAYCYVNNRRSDLALDFALKALKVWKEMRVNANLAVTNNLLGIIFYNRGQNDKAIEYYFDALKFWENEEKPEMVTPLLINIAAIYRQQGFFEDAIKNYQKALDIYQRLNDKKGIARVYSDLGVVYNFSGKKKESLHFHHQALKIFEETGDKNSTVITMSDIGEVYISDGLYEKALEINERALSIQKEIPHSTIKSQLLYQRGSLLLKFEKLSEAKKYSEFALKEATQLGYLGTISRSEQLCYMIDVKLKNYKSALQHYEQFIRYKDSINNESNRKASIRSQLKYEYEKQAAADSVAHAKENEVKSAELSRQSAELKAKKNQQYALFGGLGLVMLFAGFMFNRFKVTQKQKTIIEHQKAEVEEQKKLVEEKQKEILDSIHYARRIQLAQIPSEKRVSGMISRTKGA